MSSHHSSDNRSIDRNTAGNMKPMPRATLPVWQKSATSTSTGIKAGPQGEIVAPRPERLGNPGLPASLQSQPDRAQTSLGYTNHSTTGGRIQPGLITLPASASYANARAISGQGLPADRPRHGGALDVLRSDQTVGRSSKAGADWQRQTISGRPQHSNSNIIREAETVEELLTKGEENAEEMERQAYQREITRLREALNTQSGLIERRGREHAEQVERLRAGHAAQVKQLKTAHAEDRERLTKAYVEQLRLKDEVIRAKDAQLAKQVSESW